jgi:ArsR family transcriptional regulator
MPAVDLRKRLYERFAKVAIVLASGPRLEILELLAQRECTVESLVERTGLPVANVSQHLQLLKRRGMVTARRAGKYIHYRLANEGLVPLMTALQRVAEESNPDTVQTIARYFTSRDAEEPVTREELLRRQRAGAVVVIDVRPADEFAAGHIPGARHIPIRELEKRLNELPRAQEIVAYCRGPFCVLAFRAVAQLRARGYKARRLEEGLPQWRLSGLPVQKVDAA